VRALPCHGPLLLILLTLSAGEALARPAPSPDPPRRIVLLAQRDDASLIDQALRTLRAQLSDLPVTVEPAWQVGPGTRPLPDLAREIARSPGVLVVVWFVPGREASAHLHLAPLHRIVSRPLAEGEPGGQLEALAVIVRTQVTALLALPPRARPVAPVPPPRPRAPRPRRLGLAVEAAYAVAGHGSGVGAVHGASLGVRLRVHPAWSVHLSYRYAYEINREIDAVAARFQAFPLTLGAQGAWRRGRLQLAGSLSLGLEPVLTRTTSESPALRAGPDLTALRVSVLVGAHLAVRVAPRLWLQAGLALDVGLRDQRFLAGTASDPTVLLAPWPVRPVGTVGLAVDLL
jgi:hypothetical protein